MLNSVLETFIFIYRYLLQITATCIVLILQMHISSLYVLHLQ